MSAPLDLLAGVVVREGALSPVSSHSCRPADVTALSHGRHPAKRFKTERDALHRSSSTSASRLPTIPDEKTLPKDSAEASPTENSSSAVAADNKRALRAERNRQSAAASRERKKRHLKELESRVHYLSEFSAAVQYRAHVDKQEWSDKEKRLEEEILRLKRQLKDAMADNGRLRAALETCQHSLQ